jgi:hypothetical protein
LRQRHAFERGFPLIRSLRASAQRSTSVLFSFVLSLLIVAGSFAIRQLKTILRRSLFPIKFQVHQSWLELGLRLSRGFQGRTIFVADAHRDDGKRFVVHADEKEIC